MRIVYITILLLVVTSACKSKHRKAADEIFANAPKPTNMNVGKEHYTLYIPNGWTSERQNAYGIDYYFLLAPKTKDDPNTNINVTSESMQGLSLNNYKIKTIESVKKSIPSALILRQGEILVNGLKGCWYSYNMEPNGIKATLVSYIFSRDGVAYIITAGTQTKNAPIYRSTFDSVAKSFKFIE